MFLNKKKQQQQPYSNNNNASQRNFNNRNQSYQNDKQRNVGGKFQNNFQDNRQFKKQKVERQGLQIQHKHPMLNDIVADLERKDVLSAFPKLIQFLEQNAKWLQDVQHHDDMHVIVDEMLIQLKLHQSKQVANQKTAVSHKMLQLFNALKNASFDEWVCTAKQYNIAIDTCFKEDQFDKGNKLYEELKTKMQPTDVTYNLIVNSWVKSEDLDEALRVIKEDMTTVQPSTVTFNAIINGYVNQEQMEKAQNVIEEYMIKERGMNPDEVSVNTIVKGYCNSQQFDEAKNFIVKMKKQYNVRASEAGFKLIILGLLQQAKFDEAEHFLFEELQQTFHYNPHANLFTPMITTLVQFEQYDRAYALVKNHINIANAKTCNSLLTKFTRMKTEEGMKKAEELVKLMRRKGVELDVVSYTLMMEGYANRNDFEKAQKVINLMIHYGVEVSPITKKIIRRHGLSEKPTSKKVDDIFMPDTTEEEEEQNEIMNEEEPANVEETKDQPEKSTVEKYPEATEDNLNIKKLKKCIRENNPTDGILPLKKLLTVDKLLPPYNLVVKLCLQLKKTNDVATLISLIELFEDNEAASQFINEDDRLLLSAIECYFENGRTTDAMHMFRTMVENNPKSITTNNYNVMIEGFLKQAKVNSADEENDKIFDLAFTKCEELFAEMKQNKLKPTLHTFSLLLDGYSKLGELLKAFERYEEMKQIRIVPDAKFCTQLLQLCELRGNKKRAQELWKEMQEKYKIGTDPLSRHTFEALVNRIEPGKDKFIEKQNEKFLRENRDQLRIKLQHVGYDEERDEQGRIILSE